MPVLECLTPCISWPDFKPGYLILPRAERHQPQNVLPKDCAALLGYFSQCDRRREWVQTFSLAESYITTVGFGHTWKRRQQSKHVNTKKRKGCDLAPLIAEGSIVPHPAGRGLVVIDCAAEASLGGGFTG